MALIRSAGVDRTVFVQTQHDLAENRWVLGLAECHEFLAGVVGWVDLCSPDAGRQLQRFASHPKLVGVRHIVQGEPDDQQPEPQHRSQDPPPQLERSGRHPLTHAISLLILDS